MSVKVFILERNGDHNYENEYSHRREAMRDLRIMEEKGGYFTKDRHDNDIYVPWHMVEFIRIEEEKDNG